VGFWVYFSSSILERDDYPDKWPFTVEKVELFCTPVGDPYVVDMATEKAYALTGYGQRHEHLRNVNGILQQGKSMGWVYDIVMAEECS